MLLSVPRKSAHINWLTSHQSPKGIYQSCNCGLPKVFALLRKTRSIHCFGGPIYWQPIVIRTKFHLEHIFPTIWRNKPAWTLADDHLKHGWVSLQIQLEHKWWVSCRYSHSTLLDHLLVRGSVFCWIKMSLGGLVNCAITIRVARNKKWWKHKWMFAILS